MVVVAIGSLDKEERKMIIMIMKRERERERESKKLKVFGVSACCCSCVDCPPGWVEAKRRKGSYDYWKVKLGKCIGNGIGGSFAKMNGPTMNCHHHIQFFPTK